MNMRPSRVLKKLRAGEIVSCFKLNFADGRAFEIAAMAGFDCLWTCMEHVGNTYTDIEKQVWVTKAYDTDLVVRIPRGSYSDCIRPFELDATGIMVPHIMSLEDAKNVVRMTRFYPIGRRPVDGGNADGAYGNIDFKDYIREANEQRFVIVQIEDPEPLKDLESIASLEGIDMLFFGPGDFSHSIGAPAEFNHPRVKETRKRIAEVCREKGKFAGTVGAAESMEELVEMGYQFVNLGADVVGISQFCRGIMETVKNIVGDRIETIRA